MDPSSSFRKCVLIEMKAPSEPTVFYSTTTNSAEETRALAARLARVLPVPVALLLVGPLGSGKTVFAQGLARGLGIEEQITSPSFLLMKEYQGTRHLRHLDLFRLKRQGEVHPLGLTEDLPPDAVVVVEWADRFPLNLRLPALIVQIAVGDSMNERRLGFSASGLAQEEVMKIDHALRTA